MLFRSTGAAPAWLEIMNYLHASEPGAAPRPPEGVVRAGAEWYLAGTEPAAPLAADAPRPRLQSPVAGTIVALDPDIPSGRQSLEFAAQGGRGLLFALDGRVLGPAAAPLDWEPLPGKHTLALVDESGRSLDAAPFEVRGALAAETGAPEPDAPDPDEEPEP